MSALGQVPGGRWEQGHPRASTAYEVRRLNLSGGSVSPHFLGTYCGLGTGLQALQTLSHCSPVD